MFKNLKWQKNKIAQALTVHISLCDILVIDIFIFSKAM